MGWGASQGCAAPVLFMGEMGAVYGVGVGGKRLERGGRVCVECW